MKTNLKINRELEEKCECCGAELIEEKRNFEDEILAVTVCAICRYYNWILPSEYFVKEDKELFEKSNAWAEAESLKILEEHGLLMIFDFSEPAKLQLGENLEQIKSSLLEICKILDSWYVYISKVGNGIKITIK